MARTIFITGANGFIGQKIIQYWISINPSDRIIALSRGDNRMVHRTGCEYCSVDLVDPSSVKKVFSRFKPDIVIHCAAISHVDQCEKDKDLCHQINVQSVKWIKNACQQQNVFLLLLSTDFVFDGLEGPYGEGANRKPINEYGRSKLLAEKLLEESPELTWAIVRTVLVYGKVEGQTRSNFVVWVKQQLEQGKPINVTSNQWRTPTLVDDLVSGCYSIVNQQEVGIFHLSGEELLTPYEMAVKIANYFNYDSNLITPVDSGYFQEVGERPAKTGLLIDKAKEVLNYKPHSFIEGLKFLEMDSRKVEIKRCGD